MKLEETMKPKLVALSVLGNITLVATLLWLHGEHAREMRESALAAMRGDEAHLQLHAAALSALQSANAAEVNATEDMLRSIIATGEANMEARRRAGLGR